MKHARTNSVSEYMAIESNVVRIVQESYYCFCAKHSTSKLIICLEGRRRKETGEGDCGVCAELYDCKYRKVG